MSSWNYDRTNIIEIKYENLIKDVEMNLFTDIFRFLGFPGLALPLCLDIAWTQSLFSHASPPKNQHVRSGRAAQWRDEFTKPMARAFLDRFGDLLLRLHYEVDDSWVEQLAD